MNFDYGDGYTAMNGLKFIDFCFLEGELFLNKVVFLKVGHKKWRG